MARRSRRVVVLMRRILVLCLVLAAPAARGDEPLLLPEFPAMRATWFVPAAPAQGQARPGRVVAAIVTLPAGWTSGDAAALVAAERSAPPGRRGALLAALLAEGAAVLEVEAMPGQARDEVVAALLGALVAATRDDGAGLVVAVGFGAAGRAALDAAAEAVARAHLGAAGPRLAAGIALDAAGADFAAGAAPAPAQAWALRAPMLCAAVAAAIEEAARAAARADCAAALRPRD